jgi:hypothetical protein
LGEAPLEKTFNLWWPQLKEQIDRSIKEYAGVKNPTSASRSSEEMLRELLDLTRTQQKFLSGLVESSPATSSTSLGPKIVRGVDFNEVGYFLRRIRTALDEAVVLGKPETPKLVELRGLVMVLSKSLSPVLDKDEG